MKSIPYARERVYGLLSDMSNLEQVKERIAAMGKLKVSDFTVDVDTCTAVVEPLGKIGLRIVERKGCERIRYEAVHSPFPLEMWIDLAEEGLDGTHLQIRVRTAMNGFLLGMLSKQLEEGVEKFADILAGIPYGQSST